MFYYNDDNNNNNNNNRLVKSMYVATKLQATMFLDCDKLVPCTSTYIVYIHIVTHICINVYTYFSLILVQIDTNQPKNTAKRYIIIIMHKFLAS